MRTIVPLTLREAGDFVQIHHRHHQRPVGMKYALGLARDEELVGVAIVGRPVARHLDDGATLEVLRTCVVDGERNANSQLYGACWRVAKALGYRRLITYTQQGETGASLRGAGWRIVAQRPPRAGATGWWRAKRPRMDEGADNIPRTLWEAQP